MIRQVDALVSVGLLAMLLAASLSLAREVAVDWRISQQAMNRAGLATNESSMMRLLPLFQASSSFGTNRTGQGCVTAGIAIPDMTNPLLNFTFAIHGKEVEVRVLCATG